MWIAVAGCTGIIADKGDEPAGPRGSGVPGDLDGDGIPDGPVVVPGEDGEPRLVECNDAEPQTGATRIYRLTERQYENSVRELLGEPTIDVNLTKDDDAPSLLAVQKWNQIAADLVPAQSTWMNAYVSCDLGTSNTACAQEFLAKFAERAFRHPLSSAESTWLGAAWNAAPSGSTQSERLAYVVQAVLQAPQFLYFYSAGVDDGSGSTTKQLAEYEMAQRLSYFLWDSLPDDALLAAAAGGELDTVDGVISQATRMLADDRAKPVLRSYLTSWLDMDGEHLNAPVDDLNKDASRFDNFTPQLGGYMRTEMDAFMDYVMFEKDGSIETLFTDPRAYVNGPLAALYGVEGGPTGANQWAWVDLDTTQRAGVLTRAGFLAVHASDTDSSPIQRGVFVRKHLLCQPPTPPPPTVDNTPVASSAPGGAAVQSVREKTESLTAEPFCNGCHAGINPIGFAFEHYDALGRWQGDAENWSGAPVDSSGELVYAGLANGPVKDAVELSSRLLETDWLRECAAEAWFQHALRRNPAPLDVCSLQTIRLDTDRPGSLREVLLGFVASDVFRYINHAE
ncbi:MAG: DUF1592 domain-containing protein [Polyangiales bacterium]